MKGRIRIAAVIATAVLVASCSKGELPHLDLSNTVTLNTEEGVMSAYGLALSAERAYKALPLCRTGTKATITAPCAQRSVVVRLQQADLRAISAIQRMNAFIKAYPSVDATNVIGAASTAVGDLRAILNANGVS